MDVLTLTENVTRLNRDLEKLDFIVRDVDKRVVRLETALEFSGRANQLKVIEPEPKE